ncbi:hypothetical protein C0992_000390, partial [Termitomyces sp. T32_za158]
MSAKVSRIKLALRIIFLPVFLVVHRKEYRTTTQLQNLDDKMKDIESKYEEYNTEYHLDFDRDKSIKNKIRSFSDQISEKRERVLPLVKDKGDFFCLKNGLWQELFNLNIEIDNFSAELDEHVYAFIDMCLKENFRKLDEIMQ